MEQVLAKLISVDGELLWWNWDTTLPGVMKRFREEVAERPAHGSRLVVEWEDPQVTERLARKV